MQQPKFQTNPVLVEAEVVDGLAHHNKLGTKDFPTYEQIKMGNITRINDVLTLARQLQQGIDVVEGSEKSEKEISDFRHALSTCIFLTLQSHHGVNVPFPEKLALAMQNSEVKDQFTGKMFEYEEVLMSLSPWYPNGVVWCYPASFQLSVAEGDTTLDRILKEIDGKTANASKIAHGKKTTEILPLEAITKMLSEILPANITPESILKEIYDRAFKEEINIVKQLGKK